jgi:8-oxo-dGTP diphosphatase
MDFAQSYLGKLRTLVGHRLLHVPGGRGILEREDGKILLHKRSDFKAWALPGGAPEERESCEQAIVREIFEETGLTIKQYQACAFASEPEYEIVTYPNGDRVHGFGLVLHATKWEGELIDSNDETLAIDFFAPNQLPDMIECDRIAIEQLQTFKRTGKFQASCKDKSQKLSELSVTLPGNAKPFADSYAGQLRKIVGNHLLMIPGGRAVLEREDGKILLHRRPDFGIWGLPTGGTEDGECIEECIWREVFEETGLQMLNHQAFGFASDPNFEIVSYPNGDLIHCFSLIWHATKWQGTLMQSNDESLEIDFFDPKSLPEMLPHHKRTIEKLTEFKRTGQFVLF